MFVHTRRFGATNRVEAQWESDPDADFALNGLEFLTQTDPLKGDDYWRVTIRRAEHGVELVYRRLANRGFEVQWSELLAGPWQFLDVRENRPVFSATSDEVTVADPASGSQRFYRVQVFEP